ncbi:hypothetical protein [Patulibacter defluvii]|uniref:hypothetical protein n=1 Tax=Patulibacter defluvii TaxID=3095358 RepID=UPI002A74D202|nr:hypothetical protein [Patulibacter sp. DM4]
MRGPGSSLLAAVVAALLLIGGVGAAPAAASDEGLRQLVKRADRIGDRFEKRITILARRKATSRAAGVRTMRTMQATVRDTRQRYRGERRKAVAELPETAQATEGRVLLLAGLKGLSQSLDRLHGTIDRYLVAVRRAGDRDVSRRALRRFQRNLDATERTMKRAGRQMERASKLIRAAPPVTAPAPAG